MGRLLALVLLLAAALAPPAAAAQPLAAPGRADGVARAEVAALRRATAVNDGDANKLYDDLDRAFAAEPGVAQRVIVSFVAGVDSRRGARLAAGVAPGATVERTFTIVPAYAGTLTHGEALAVAALPEVRQIELDSPGIPELDTATAVMGADAVVDGLGVTGSLDGLEDAVTAEDITIAILDTGFDVRHADLDGKLLAFVDLADGREDAYDDDGHGTHVASIAAGWGAVNPAQRGVAPGAGIVGLRIENASHALAGYEWIVEHRVEHRIRVATMSFGFGVATDGTTALERAVDATWDAGVVCFKSNGNSGPGASTMTVPAAARGILAMGSLLDPGGAAGNAATALDDRYGFLLSEFSSRGPTADGRIKPDLVAPGESISAADAGTSAGYVTLSGTSMASPFGAGSAALVLAADPSLSPDAVRALLYATAEDFGAPGADPEYGYGRLQVLDAVEAALRGRGTEPAPVARPDVPAHVSWTAASGVATSAVTVTDAGAPIAVNAIGSPAVLGLFVTGPSGAPVAAPPLNADRQHNVSFLPAAPGSYTIHVVTSAGAVVDVSFGG